MLALAAAGNSIATSDAQAMLSTKDGNFVAVVWDFETPDQKVSDHPFFTKMLPNHPAEPVQVTVSHLVPNCAYQLEIYRTGFHANDAYTAYIEMGSPKQLTPTQISKLNRLTRDLPETKKSIRTGSTGTVDVTVPMNSNDIALIKVYRRVGK